MEGLVTKTTLLASRRLSCKRLLPYSSVGLATRGRNTESLFTRLLVGPARPTWATEPSTPVFSDPPPSLSMTFSHPLYSFTNRDPAQSLPPFRLPYELVPPPNPPNSPHNPRARHNDYALNLCQPNGAPFNPSRRPMRLIPPQVGEHQVPPSRAAPPTFPHPPLNTTTPPADG